MYLVLLLREKGTNTRKRGMWTQEAQRKWIVEEEEEEVLGYETWISNIYREQVDHHGDSSIKYATIA